jgi:hypothetical protein
MLYGRHLGSKEARNYVIYYRKQLNFTRFPIPPSHLVKSQYDTFCPLLNQINPDPTLILHFTRFCSLKNCTYELKPKLCTYKVGYKEVKNTTSLGMSKVVVIKRHVSAYSEAIFRFYKCWL